MEPKQAAAADRLSSLPAELRDEILIRLDLRDAVRTSVLSRTWRHLWKPLSVLSLSFHFGTHPSVVDSSRFAAAVLDEADLLCIAEWKIGSLDETGPAFSAEVFLFHHIHMKHAEHGHPRNRCISVFVQKKLMCYWLFTGSEKKLMCYWSFTGSVTYLWWLSFC